MKKTLADIATTPGQWYTAIHKTTKKQTNRVLVTIHTTIKNTAQLSCGVCVPTFNFTDALPVSHNEAKQHLSKDIENIKLNINTLKGAKKELAEIYLHLMEFFYYKHFANKKTETIHK